MKLPIDYKPWAQRTKEEKRGREQPRMMLTISQWNAFKKAGQYLGDCDIVKPIGIAVHPETVKFNRGKLIGIVGYAGSGKTTVTREATQSRMTPFPLLACKHHNFSRPIVNMLAAMGIPQAMLNDKSRWNEPLDILCGHSIRYAATTLGTEWGRDQIGRDVWTRIALAEAEDLRNRGYHVIIDNVRFPSEYDAMRQTEGGAFMIALLRRGLHDGTIEHESERHIKTLQGMCEYEINNSGTFPEAVEKMRKIIVDIVSDYR